MSTASVSLIQSYLTNRQQCVKIGNNHSDWKLVKRGVPQGSLTGPLLFNIFLNDFVVQMQQCCDVYNYADDNSLCYSHKDQNVMTNVLEECSNKAITWFKENHMQANPKKFQSMVLQRQSNINNININVGNETISPSDFIKLLGVSIDKDLSFKAHVTNICKKTSRQVNVLGRISKNLSHKSKMKILNSFILSNFNYCSLVYHECGPRNTRKLEKIQERALRTVFSNYEAPYSELLKNAKLQMLCSNRCKKAVEHVHRVIHNLVPLFPHTFYPIKSISYDMRKKIVFKVPKKITNIEDFNVIKISMSLYDFNEFE